MSTTAASSGDFKIYVGNVTNLKNATFSLPMLVINNFLLKGNHSQKENIKYCGTTPLFSSTVLPAVSVSFKVEVEMKNTPFKGALETFLVRIFPFFVYNSESLFTMKIVNN